MTLPKNPEINTALQDFLDVIGDENREANAQEIDGALDALILATKAAEAIDDQSLKLKFDVFRLIDRCTTKERFDYKKEARELNIESIFKNGGSLSFLKNKLKQIKKAENKEDTDVQSAIGIFIDATRDKGWIEHPDVIQSELKRLISEVENHSNEDLKDTVLSLISKVTTDKFFTYESQKQKEAKEKKELSVSDWTAELLDDVLLSGREDLNFVKDLNKKDHNPHGEYITSRLAPNKTDEVYDYNTKGFAGLKGLHGKFETEEELAEALVVYEAFIKAKFEAALKAKSEEKVSIPGKQSKVNWNAIMLGNDVGGIAEFTVKSEVRITTTGYLNIGVTVSPKLTLSDKQEDQFGPMFDNRFTRDLETRSTPFSKEPDGYNGQRAHHWLLPLSDSAQETDLDKETDNALAKYFEKFEEEVRVKFESKKDSVEKVVKKKVLGNVDKAMQSFMSLLGNLKTAASPEERAELEKRLAERQAEIEETVGANSPEVKAAEEALSSLEDKLKEAKKTGDTEKVNTLTELIKTAREKLKELRAEFALKTTSLSQPIARALEGIKSMTKVQIKSEENLTANTTIVAALMSNEKMAKAGDLIKTLTLVDQTAHLLRMDERNVQSVRSTKQERDEWEPLAKKEKALELYKATSHMTLEERADYLTEKLGKPISLGMAGAISRKALGAMAQAANEKLFEARRFLTFHMETELTEEERENLFSGTGTESLLKDGEKDIDPTQAAIRAISKVQEWKAAAAKACQKENYCRKALGMDQNENVTPTMRISDAKDANDTRNENARLEKHKKSPIEKVKEIGYENATQNLKDALDLFQEDPTEANHANLLGIASLAVTDNATEKKIKQQFIKQLKKLSVGVDHESIEKIDIEASLADGALEAYKKAQGVEEGASDEVIERNNAQVLTTIYQFMKSDLSAVTYINTVVRQFLTKQIDKRYHCKKRIALLIKNSSIPDERKANASTVIMASLDGIRRTEKVKKMELKNPEASSVISGIKNQNTNLSADIQDWFNLQSLTERDKDTIARLAKIKGVHSSTLEKIDNLQTVDFDEQQESLEIPPENQIFTALRALKNTGLFNAMVLKDRESEVKSLIDQPESLENAQKLTEIFDNKEVVPHDKLRVALLELLRGKYIPRDRVGAALDGDKKQALEIDGTKFARFQDTQSLGTLLKTATEVSKKNGVLLDTILYGAERVQDARDAVKDYERLLKIEDDKRQIFFMTSLQKVCKKEVADAAKRPSKWADVKAPEGKTVYSLMEEFSKHQIEPARQNDFLPLGKALLLAMTEGSKQSDDLSYLAFTVIKNSINYDFKNAEARKNTWSVDMFDSGKLQRALESVERDASILPVVLKLKYTEFRKFIAIYQSLSDPTHGDTNYLLYLGRQLHGPLLIDFDKALRLSYTDEEIERVKQKKARFVNQGPSLPDAK